MTLIQCISFSLSKVIYTIESFPFSFKSALCDSKTAVSNPYCNFTWCILPSLFAGFDSLFFGCLKRIHIKCTARQTCFQINSEC